MRGRPSASSSIALPRSASRVAAAAQHESFLRFLAVEERVLVLPPPRSRSRSDSASSYLVGDDASHASCASMRLLTSASSIGSYSKSWELLPVAVPRPSAPFASIHGY